MKVFSGGKSALLFLLLGVIFLGFVSFAGAKDVKKDALDAPKGKVGFPNLTDNVSAPVGASDLNVLVRGRGALGDVPGEVKEELQDIPQGLLDIPLANDSNGTEMDSTEMNISDGYVTDLNWTDVNGTGLNLTGVNGTAFNETETNWTGVNDTDINDTDINDTGINVSFINGTEMSQTVLPEDETSNSSQGRSIHQGPTMYVLANGKPVARVRDAQIDYLFSDSINSVRLVADGKGLLVSRSSFYPFGQSLDLQSYLSGESAYGFTGKERDASLDYFGARYYLPRTGTFTSVDPHLRPGISPYMYALDNPVKLIDPDGRTEQHPMATNPPQMDEQMFRWNQELLLKGNRVGGVFIRDPATLQTYYGYAPLPKGAGIIGTGLMIYYNALYFYNNVHGDPSGRHVPLDAQDLAMTQRDNRVRNQFLERQGINLQASLDGRRGLGEAGLPNRYYQHNRYPVTGTEVAYLVEAIDNRRDFTAFLEFIGTDMIQAVGRAENGDTLYVAVGDNSNYVYISPELYELYVQKFNWYKGDTWPKPPRQEIPVDTSTAPADALAVARPVPK